MSKSAIDYVIELKDKINEVLVDLSLFRAEVHNDLANAQKEFGEVRHDISVLENKFKKRIDSMEHEINATYATILKLEKKELFFVKLLRKIARIKLFLTSVITQAAEATLSNFIKIIFLVLLITFLTILFGDYQINQYIKDTLDILK